MKKAHSPLQTLYASLGEDIDAEFYPYTSLKHTIRKRHGKIFVRISDLLVDAPPDVLLAIGRILLAKLNKKRVSKKDRQVYEKYCNSDELQHKVSQILPRRRRPVPIISGKHHNLHDSFRRVNTTYFNSIMEKPLLTWSSRKAKRTLGKYDPQRDAVIISRMLDSPVIPEAFLDFIMYHELLHKKHGIVCNGARHKIHTRAFKKDEQKFAEYEKMKAFLHTISDLKI
ncbi:MAG: M48 family peptidase [Theionarchaea archaeon]|nr:M48 family peptidase [Theionarchaea archaeon]